MHYDLEEFMYIYNYIGVILIIINYIVIKMK